MTLGRARVGEAAALRPPAGQGATREQSEEDANNLAQKLGQPQSFSAVFPQEGMGQLSCT